MTLGIQVSWDRLVEIVDANIQYSVSKRNKENNLGEVIDLTSSPPIHKLKPIVPRTASCSDSGINFYLVTQEGSNIIEFQGNNGYGWRNSNGGAISKNKTQGFPGLEWTPSFYGKIKSKYRPNDYVDFVRKEDIQWRSVKLDLFAS